MFQTRIIIMKQKCIFLLFTMLTMFEVLTYSQNKIGNNPATINAGSLLELESTSKGLLLPRIPLNNVTKWTLDGTPANGMMIINETGLEPKGIYYWSTDSLQWIRVVNKFELSTLIANYINQNTTVRDSIIKVINNTITAGGVAGKDLTSNSAILKVTNGTGATIKSVQVDLDKNELGHLLNTSPLADSLSIAISNNTVIRDSIKSVVNNTITTGGIAGKDLTSNSAILKVTNGTGATIKSVQVDLDKNELGHLLNTSPLADSLSIAISNNTVIRDSIKSVVNNTITTGGIAGKDITSNSAVLKVTNGTGATIKSVQVDLDKNELGHLLNTSPVADSLSIAISNNAAIRDSIKSIMNNPSFNTDRIITLGGTSVTGQNLGAGGKTMAQFFEAFFFPAVAATPPASTLTTATTTFPYSIWKSWGNPPSSNLSFAWSVTNLSLTDNTDDKAITSIKLKTGVTELANATPTGGNQSGNFTGIPFANTVLDPKTTFTKTYTLEVIDAQPQTVLKDIVLTMSPAIRLTYAVPTLTPSTTVYEYDVNNKDLTLGWSITPNDETVTDISVDGTSTGSTASTGTQAVTFKTLANGGTVAKTFPLIVTGNIYSAGTAKNSASVSWDNRLYRGTITSAVAPSDGSFSFDDTKIKALPLVDSKLGGDWKSTAGYDFVCGAGGQYVCFAYPDDNKTPVVQYYDSNFSSWMTYVPSDLTIINRASFVNQNGYALTNYKLVFVNVQYFSATVKVRLQ